MFVRTVAPGVELRLLEERHADDLFATIDRNRERLRRWFPWVDRTLTPEDSRLFIRTGLDQYAAQLGLHLGIWTDGRLMGGIGAQRIDWANRATPLGYWLDAKAEGKGIVTQSCAALIDHFFGELLLHRIEIRCGVANTRSCAVPSRLGFTREGVLRDAEWLNDHYHDLVVWSMLAPEWKRRRA
jgi:ribosomal-protein-serine acetyltransferase